MKKNTQDVRARGAYGLLFFVSLAIPLFHYRVLAPALWKIRYPGGLHPIEILTLYHLGGLFTIVPIALLILIALSWKIKPICTPTILARVAIGITIFTTIYAIICAVTLWIQININ